VVSGYSDLTAYETDDERNAVCAEMARMLRSPRTRDRFTARSEVMPIISTHKVTIARRRSRA
jgi:hypothetical protein